MTVEEYLGKSYTCYHAAKAGAQYLCEHGFADLDGGKKENAKGYYRVCGGALLAFRAGSGKTLGAVITHTDSPSLRIRYERGGESKLILDTEKYGGGLMRSFLDRKLIIAGRVMVKNGEKIESRLVSSDYFVTVPSLAVHLGGGQEGELTLSKDFRPLIGECDDLYASLGVPDAIDGDLFCVPADLPFRSGANGEYICSPRIDNLVSVYASLRAICESAGGGDCLIAAFAGEETGSTTREGAQSNLLERFVADVYKAAGRRDDAKKALANAFVFSCDGAHALHPTHTEKYSADAPKLGGGIVIKRNDNYATDGLASAAAKEIFARAGVKSQTYFHNPDLRCGSTVGLAVSRELGALTCDIGVAQLAMHSALELAAAEDVESLAVGLARFFGMNVKADCDGVSFVK